MPALELLEQPIDPESDAAPERQPESLVLLVDSDPSSVEFMARALSQAGVRVLVADRIGGTGGAAAQLRTHVDINVIVLDPQAVPGRNNLADLQASGLREDIQVILVAEPVTLARYTQMAHADVADFLPKPVARRTLLRAVLEAQRRHSSLKEPLLQEGRLARLVERAVTPPSRRLSAREQPAELRTLQLLADLDDCRASTLDGILEPDATWSMLTELLRARLARRRLSVTSLCLASKSPVTTALRRIDRLLEAGLVSCTQDPKDRRRKYIELTADGGERLQEALRAVNQRLGGEETTFP
jgi:DNA-binding response OmpR family regulator